MKQFYHKYKFWLKALGFINLLLWFIFGVSAVTFYILDTNSITTPVPFFDEGNVDMLFLMLAVWFGYFAVYTTYFSVILLVVGFLLHWFIMRLKK